MTHDRVDSHSTLLRLKESFELHKLLNSLMYCNIIVSTFYPILTYKYFLYILNSSPVIRYQKSKWGLPEMPRGSAAWAGVTRDGGVVSEIFQKKVAKDDPMPEMAVCRTDILL